MPKDATKQKKKKLDKAERLKILLNVDLCACGTLHGLKCEGVCRQSHTNSNGVVECPALYTVDTSLVKINTKKKKKDKNSVDDNSDKTSEKNRRRTRRDNSKTYER